MRKRPSSFSRDRCAIEWPTCLLAALIHGAWLALTGFHADIPTPILFLAGGIVIAWHGSLQHEVIHGHPTRLRWINDLLGSAPLSLWLPYAVYRRTHVAHHATPYTTDPFDDPESHYRERAGGVRTTLARWESTLIGRLLLGPPIRIGSFVVSEISRVRHDSVAVAREWAPHLACVALLLWWLGHVALDLGRYLLCFVYPGMVLSLLRSFAEHRAQNDARGRSAIVERAGPFGLLFLNNNLHAVHHARPDLPWYAIPTYHMAHADRFASAPHYRGYGEIALRFAFRPQDDVVHPAYRDSER